MRFPMHVNKAKAIFGSYGVQRLLETRILISTVILQKKRPDLGQMQPATAYSSQRLINRLPVAAGSLEFYDRAGKKCMPVFGRYRVDGFPDFMTAPGPSGRVFIPVVLRQE